MRTFVRAGLAGALACGALVTVLTVGRGGDAPAPPQGPYVALGDSYTSGPRIPTQTGKPAGCDRSDGNYPSLYVSDGADEVTARIDAAGERLAGALSEVRRRAPRAEVYVVGYPAIRRSCRPAGTAAPTT
ncbi:hypothetical protein [Streptomyces sp. GQFP]|uniref:hypothetical protein n=1 Tax=Streptomyces sp. GQFP TaxID=2907545 RepID=UPI001F288887|nr:hypothetical protein [Streptomyces sp. GQFP]UIX28718.1 hypothetical protein LUX31_01040 [Streptomyces sp. GQFP]